jgi:hypothetical protein
MFALRITRADPRKLFVEIFLTNAGTSICVGQAIVQGASKQKRHRAASIAACRGVISGEISAKFASYSSADSFGADSCSVIRRSPHPQIHQAILAPAFRANLSLFAPVSSCASSSAGRAATPKTFPAENSFVAPASCRRFFARWRDPKSLAIFPRRDFIQPAAKSGHNPLNHEYGRLSSFN